MIGTCRYDPAMDLAGAPSTVPEHEADDPDRFLNRELSWLDFNARVLESAADPRVPLLERAKFCAIFSQNLDEFFQVRVAGLSDQLIAKLGRTSPDGKSPGDQLKAIAARVGDLVDRLEHLFLEDIVPGLAEVGIVFSSWEELDDDDRAFLHATVSAHRDRTGSAVADRVLADWPVTAEAFRKVMPRDYARVLQVMKQAESEGLDEAETMERVMEASRG